MTTAIGNRGAAVLVTLAVAASVLGGCSTVSSPQSPSSPSGSAQAGGPAAPPPTDEQSRAQVVDAARAAVRAAGLRVTFASFQWEWCNDQGEPPFHGRVDLTFEVAAGGGASAFTQLAGILARQPGWAPGPPPGLRPAGDVVHTGGVMVIVGPTSYPDRGTVEVYGECLNMNDHRTDNQVADITAEVAGS